MITKGSVVKGRYIGFFGGYHSKDIKLCLSNWYFSYFLMDIGSSKELRFYCAEQALMYIKAFIFNDKEMMSKIYNQQYNPVKYKKYGRLVKGYSDTAWDKYKELIMKKILWQKFGQDSEIRSYLISTKSKKLIECNPYDLIWGAGLSLDDDFQFESNWRGESLLGKTLMETRKSFIDVGVN